MARNRRQQEKQRQDWHGTILIVVAVCGIIAMGGGYAYLRMGAEGVDRASLCPERGRRGQIVVLVDNTDALSTAQREDLRNKLRELKTQVPKGHELSIFTVGEIREQLLNPQVQRCNPGMGEDVGSFSGNPELAKRRWEKDFSRPFDEAIDRVTTAEAGAPRSPIMESIQSVAITAFGRGQNDVPRRLVIVSDMLQNTSEFSHYRKFPAFEQFRGTEYYKKVKADLRGVTVTVILLRRERVLADRTLIEFWQGYVADAGAVLDSVKAVQG